MALTASPAFWVITFAVYFAVQVLVRVLTGGALGLDEAQIMRHGQYLSWGYGAQPPLYAWLQFLVLQLTGNTIVGLSLLKNAFLFASVSLWFQLFRREVGVAKAGLLASAFVLVPQFSWESQRALTHSVLAGTVTSVYYFWFWTMLRKGNLQKSHYGVLGAIIGAGILAKSTFLIVPFATFLATATMPSLRSKLSKSGLGLSALTAVVVVFPYAVWALENREMAFSSAWKFKVAEEATFVQAAVPGMMGLAVALISFLFLAVVLLSVIWLIFRAPRKKEAPEFLHWLLRSVICAVIVMVLVVLATKTTNVKDRWLQAALMPAGAILVWFFLDRVTGRGRRVLCYTMVALALLVVVAQPYHSLTGRSYRASPYDQIAPKLASVIGQETKVIVGDWLGGNLIFQNVDLNVMRPSEELDGGLSYALVGRGTWPAERQERIIDQYRALGLKAGKITEFSAPYRFAPEEVFTLVLVPLSPN